MFVIRINACCSYPPHSPQDGRLSYDEVVAMRTMLETSQATQFGDLLKEEL